MRSLLVIFVMLAACGPSKEEVQAAAKTEYVSSRIALGISLRACDLALRMQASRIKPDPVMVANCSDRTKATDRFLGACRAHTGAASACELELQRIVADSK